MSLVPKGEGEGDPMKLQPLTVLSQIYRIWAGLRMEDALQWQEQWIHRESYSFRPHKRAMDAATVLTLLVELAQVLTAPLVGAGTDYTKCFNLIPQAISWLCWSCKGWMTECCAPSAVCRANSSACSKLKDAWAFGGQPPMACCKAAHLA